MGKLGAMVMTASVIAALLSDAAAHIQPSVDENNRYLKLGLLGDRVRLVYTVYIGERPGMQARPLMDHNRDGAISDDEASLYGTELGNTVAGNLTISVDGEPYPLAWRQIHVGMGTPSTRAGSFAVDLVAWLCLADPEQRRDHHIVINDTLALPSPGETEIYLEESPGVRIVSSGLGENSGEAKLKFQWRGQTDYLRKRGLHLNFTVDPNQASIAADSCGDTSGATPRGESSAQRQWLALLLAGLLIVSAAALWLLRRRRA